MKRKFFIISIIIVAILILVGNLIWNNKVDDTVKKVEEKIENPAKDKTTTEKEPSNENTSQASIEDSNETTATQESNGQGQGQGQNTAMNSNGNDLVNEGSKVGKNTNSMTPSNSWDDRVDPESQTESGSIGVGSEKKSLTEIKNYYSTTFQELEAQETSRVDQLVVQAKADFVSNKSSKSELVSKYQEAGAVLEQNADIAFNSIYQQLQYDLEYNGYSLNEAQEFRQTYNEKKEERLTRIISQIRDF